MRISTVQIFNIANRSMADANEALVKTQEQLATGRRVITPSDDPIAATQILSLQQELSSISQYKNNISVARDNLTQEENILDNVNNTITRIQEITIQAGNIGALSPSDYKTLATEIDGRIEELQNLLNTRNVSGDYIFGGYQSQQQPFTGNAAEGFSFEGDEGQHFVQIANGTSIATNDSGKSIFMNVPSVNPTVTTSVSASNRSDPPLNISLGLIVDQDTYNDFYPEDMVITFGDESAILPAGPNFTVTEKSTGRILLQNQPYASGESIEVMGVELMITGQPAPATATQNGDRLFINSSEKQDILTTFSRISEVMRDYDGTEESKNLLSSTVADTLVNLDSAQTNVLETMSSIGTRINSLDSTESLHLDSELITEELLSDLQDLDYAEAATRLSAESLILQAAQSSFLRVSQLSLFNQL